jgi:TonB family protein
MKNNVMPIVFLCLLLTIAANVIRSSTLPHSSQLDGQTRPRVSISGQLMANKLKHWVRPVYPKEARIKGIEGTIKLHTTVARDGSVGQLDVVSGPAELVQAALDAVSQWRYEPTILKGEPVEVDTTIDVIFQLKKR